MALWCQLTRERSAWASSCIVDFLEPFSGCFSFQDQTGGLLCSIQPSTDMRFGRRNAYYLRISGQSVLPLYVRIIFICCTYSDDEQLYLDERHVDWMSEQVLHHVLSDLRPKCVMRQCSQRSRFRRTKLRSWSQDTAETQGGGGCPSDLRRSFER